MHDRVAENKKPLTGSRGQGLWCTSETVEGVRALEGPLRTRDQVSADPV